MSTFIPNSNAQECPQRYEFTQDRGWRIVRVFKGGQSAIESTSDQLIAAGYDVSLKEGPVWELEGSCGVSGYGQTTGGGELPVDAWELQGNEIEKNLLHSTCTAVASLDPADLASLKDTFAGKGPDGREIQGYDEWYEDTGGDPWGLLNLWLMGTESLLVVQPTLRRTRTVSRAYQIGASLTGIGQIHSSTRIIADENIPPIVAGTMLASSALSRTGAQSDTQGFHWGWYKCYPQISLAAYGKTQIVQEWRWNLWADLIYAYNA